MVLEVHKALLVQKAHVVFSERRVTKAYKVLRVQEVPLALRVSKVHRVAGVPPAYRVPVVTQAPLSVHVVHRAPRA